MNRRFVLTVGTGCLVLILLAVVTAGFVWSVPSLARSVTGAAVAEPNRAQAQPLLQASTPAPTFTPAAGLSITATQTLSNPQIFTSTSSLLTGRYAELHPGVVSVLVLINSARTGQQGAGAGSGFILDNEGHIVTNNHVVANATFIIVAFADGNQEQAQVLGTDVNSDLAVLKVDQVPEGMHPLALGNSDQLRVGDWVIAIGNPFGLGGSMTLGIVSALGRSIPSGVTPFSIPGAIQTDAAINPGNSGGPLIDMTGQVVGINAQIETGGTTNANSGVGFAIPANVVRHVVPSLIANGSFEWPWLGIAGGNVSLLTMQANDLPSEQGAYISQVTTGSPAEAAGLQGNSGQTMISGIQVGTGGDVVVQADDQQISSFDDLLSYIAFKAPGDTVTLTVLRNGERQQIQVTLTARPANTPMQNTQNNTP
ncbi:MAG: trypsin-like peptidase domain-containing protein [Caldilineaceae bacterium]